MFSYLIIGITYAFTAAVQPGPLQTFLVSQTLSNGWKRTIPALFAPLISDGPIIVLVLFVLIRVPSWFVQILQCAGGIFLLYLAFGTFRTWQNFDMSKDLTAQTRVQTLLKAATINFLNPNPYISWSLVMGPLLLKGWREASINGLALLIGFYSFLILFTLGIILLFAAARNLGSKVSRTLVGISVIALTLFGLYELWLGTGGRWWS